MTSHSTLPKQPQSETEAAVPLNRAMTGINFRNFFGVAPVSCSDRAVQQRAALGFTSEAAARQFHAVKHAGPAHSRARAERRDSMAATSSSNAYVPSWRSPLMKKVGVPFTPLRTPPRKWARTP
jgi:hypothetical protein